MSNFPLEIDTKGTCLLCLKPKSIFKRKQDDEEYNRLNSTTTTAIKMLLRYLKVDVTKLTHLSLSSSSSVISSGSDNVNLLVTLCDECSFIATSFLELFQTFENIRLQMDMRVHQLQKVMENGLKDQRRVQEYDKRMSTGARKDKMNDSMAKRLRHETMTKASCKAARSPPRISLRDINLKSSKLDLEDDNDGKRRKSSRSLTSFQIHEILPIPSSDMELELETESILCEEADNEKDPLRMDTESSEDDEENVKMTSDVSYYHDDDYDEGSGAADNRSEDDEYATGNVTSATDKLQPSKPALFKVHLDVATERYYDKSRKRARWKCNICGDKFAGRQNLRIHKLRKHMMTVIKDMLPADVSENRVTLALNRIIGRTPIISKRRNSSPQYECSFCQRKEWSIKVHLLMHHLDKVGEEAEDCKDMEINTQIPVSSRKRQRKQSMCKRDTSGEVQESIVSSDANNCLRDNDKYLDAADNQSDREPEEEDDVTKKVSLANVRQCNKPARLKINVDVTTEKYSDKSNKRVNWKCSLCGETFTERKNIRFHKLRKHMMTVIKDKLPDTITENLVALALNRIIGRTPVIAKGRNSRPQYECLFCQRKEWSIKVHLLMHHLDKVGEEAEGCKDMEINTQIPVSSRKRQRKQSMCKRDTSDKVQESIVSADANNCLRDNDPADNQSDRKPEEDDDVSKKVSLATGRQRKKPDSFKISVETEKYYDKSRKRVLWKCNLCGDTFTEKGALRNHKLRKHMMTVIKDKLPDTVPENRVILALDRIVARAPIISKNRYFSPQYECPFCKKKEWSIKVHVLRHHFDKVLEEVEDCKYIMETRTQTVSSLKRQRKRLKLSVAAKQHIMKEHLKAGTHLQCDYCGKPFAIVYNLRDHLIRNHPAAFFDDKLPPGISDDGFNEAMERILDTANVIGKSHGKDPNPRDDCILECPFCGKSARRRWNVMRMHIANCHLEEVIEEASSGVGFNVSTDIQDPPLKTESEPVNVEGDCKNEDIDWGNEGVDASSDANSGEVDKEFNNIRPNHNPSPPPVVKNATLLQNSDQRVGQFWKIQQKFKIIKANKCDHCGVSFTERRRLQWHKLRMHTMITLKDRLPPSIAQEDDITNGLDWILAKSEKYYRPSNQAGYICFFCKSKPNDYKVHLLHVHLDEVVKEIEEIQGDPLFKRSRPALLRRTTGGYKCRTCGENFCSQQTLLVHKGEKHPEDSGEDEDQSIVCHHCNEYFFRVATLQAHLALEHPTAYYADCMPAGVTDKDFSEVVTAMADTMLKIGESKGSVTCIHCDKCFDKIRPGKGQKHECRLHLTRVHLYKVIGELKRKESLVETAEKSSDNLRTGQDQEQSYVSDMDCDNECGPGLGDGTVAEAN